MREDMSVKTIKKLIEIEYSINLRQNSNVVIK